MANPKTKGKSEQKVLELNDAERFGLEAAINTMNQAQAQVNGLAASIVTANGLPAETQVRYDKGKLPCDLPS